MRTKGARDKRKRNRKGAGAQALMTVKRAEQPSEIKINTELLSDDMQLDKVEVPPQPSPAAENPAMQVSANAPEEAVQDGLDIEAFAKSFASMVADTTKALTQAISVATKKPYFAVSDEELTLHKLAAEMFVRQNVTAASQISWSTIAWAALLSYATPRVIALFVEYYQSKEEKHEKPRGNQDL